MQTIQFPSNWELSTTRAASVVRALSEVHGVPTGGLSASGFAEYKPLSDNTTPDGRAKNRRVELLVVMND
jgi:chemotaxis protein MotB